MSFAFAFRESFAVSTFQDFVSHFALKTAEVEIFGKVLGAKNLLVRLQLWTRLSST